MGSLAPLLAMLAIPLSAGAQLTATSPPRPATLVRDGAIVWEVVRDPIDRSRVSARSGARTFHARVDRHALVRIASGIDAREVLRAHGAIAIREVSRTIGAWRAIDAGGADGLELAARLAGAPGVIDAIPDWILDHEARAIEVPPDDPRYPGQWYLARIGIEGAWRLEDGDPATTIVIIDSGCDATHPDLAGNLDRGRDVIDMDDDPTPLARAGAEHGTACAGLAAAATDNAIGIAGTCPECRLRCVRLIDGGTTPVSISADVEAFQFAIDVDAAVVSNSWGFVEPTSVPAMLRDVILALIDRGRGGRGAIVLFASGNDDRELATWEIEGVRGVVTVGAVNNFDEATAFSNRGEPVDVVAPTGSLTTDLVGAAGADPGDYTSSFGGTSSSCPVAAGVAGLLVSAAPERSGAELAAILIDTARQSPFATPDERGHDEVYGYGRIAPEAALRRALGIEPIDSGMIDASAAIDAGTAIDAGSIAPASGACGCRTAARSREGSHVIAIATACVIALVVRRRSR